jgi:hypothetical protein
MPRFAWALVLSVPVLLGAGGPEWPQGLWPTPHRPAASFLAGQVAGTRPPSTTSRLRGRVMAAAQPVADARITVASLESSRRFSANSDDGGYYELRVPAGAYTVLADKTGFVPQYYRKGRVTVRAGSDATSVDITLKQAGVIAGTVLDLAGASAAGVVVTAFVRGYQRGEREWLSVGTPARTDDRGMFRLFGLAPGDYFVLATPPVVTVPAPEGALSAGPTFYPTTIDDSSALPVSVQEEATATISIQLCATRSASIRGMAPRGGGTVTARPLSGMPTFRTGSVGGDGAFTIRELVAGSYVVTHQGFGTAASETLAAATVTAIPEEPAFVVLAPVNRLRVRGRVRLPSAAAAPSGASPLRVAVTSVQPGRGRPVTQTQVVNDDLTFELVTWPGVLWADVVAHGTTWVVKTVRLNGRDVSDTGVADSAGDDIDALEIELTDSPPEVSGTVEDATRATVYGYTAVLFSTDSERWTLGSGRYVRIARPDQHGRFTVRTLPPGSYYAVAVEDTIQMSWADPEVLTSIVPQATKFSLSASSTLTLQLRMATRY